MYQKKDENNNNCGIIYILIKRGILYSYPNKKTKSEKVFVDVNNTSSKGMDFEAEISKANDYYYTNNIANIHKKPTPIKVMKVSNYKEGVYNKTKITSAVFEKKSTTDYNGVYKGYYVDFEAKETVGKSFNIKSNLHGHQIEHLISVKKHGGLSFVLISMRYYNKVFAIDIEQILRHQKTLIGIDYLYEKGYELTSDNTLYLNYLEYVDNLIERNI